jgi:PAS domain S-box-containing protein
MENAPDGVYLSDLAGNFLYGNRMTEEIIGYKREEIVGKNMMELNLLAPEGLAKAAELLQANSRGQSTGPDEFTLIKKGGSRIIVEINTSVAKRIGQPVVIGFVREITDRKLAEEKNQALLAATQNEKKVLSILIDSMTDEVWFADLQGKFILMNSAAIKEFGLDSDRPIEVEALAKSLEVFRPDGSLRPVEEAPPLRALSGEVVRNQEEIVRTPASSELRHRQVSATPVRDPMGHIVGAVSVVRDITELKRAEEELRASEKKYHEWFDFLPIPVYEMDLEANITAANRAVFEALKGTEDDLKKGFNAWKLLSPEDVQKSAENIQRLLKGEKVEGTEYSFKRLDGSVFSAIVISSVIYGQGRPVGLRGAIIDITERKQAESLLNEQIAELQRWHEATLGRESRVLDLKREVNELMGKAGQPPRYPSVDSQDEKEG